MLNTVSPGTTNEMPGPGNSDQTSQKPAANVMPQIAIGHLKADSVRMGLTRMERTGKP